MIPSLIPDPELLFQIFGFLEILDPDSDQGKS